MKITLIRTAKPVYAWKKEYTAEAFAQAMTAYANAGIGGFRADANVDADTEAANAVSGGSDTIMSGMRTNEDDQSVKSPDKTVLPVKKLSTSGRPVYVGPERYCLETAEAMFDNLAPAAFLSTPVNAAGPDLHQKNKVHEANEHEANEMEAFIKKTLDSSYLSVQSPLYVTEMLREVPFDSSPYTGRTFSLSSWQRKAWLQRFRKGVFDKKAESRARAAKLIAQIRASGRNPVIIADEHMVNILARELKRNGFHIKRGGMLRVDYLERIVATDNEPHCGGCMHDCPLSNPGCMIGKDKAAKQRSSR